MFPTEIFRSPPFRLAAAFATAIVAVALLLFAFIYWQTEIFETARIDRLLQTEARALAGEGMPEIVVSIRHRLAGDMFHLAFAGLFTPDGQLVAGNLQHIPRGLPIDGVPNRVSATGVEPGAPGFAVVRAVAVRLRDGKVLVIGRDIAVLAELRAPVLRALELAVVPAFLLSLFAGALLSRRASARVKVVHESIERIMRGDLHERLPARGTRDDLDRLAVSVNRMLDRIERLLLEVKGVGDNIAHDLRTPLARARAKLERGRNTAGDVATLRGVIDTAVTELDQMIGIITALLRIGEIESGRRRSGFGPLDLAELAREAYELYQPVCEEHQLTLDLDIAARPFVSGDAELLMEAVANLLDNAMKFTPAGGRVRITVAMERGTPVLSVQDTGPGVPESEREKLLRRFYRSEASRHTAGHGLGLNIVGAIVRLHQFRLALRDPPQGTGAIFAILASLGEEEGRSDPGLILPTPADRRQPAPA